MIVNVTLPSKNYDILIDRHCLRECGEWLENLWTIDKKVAIITDENVAAIYLDSVVNTLERQGFKVITNIVKAGEPSKSMANAEAILTWLAGEKMTRSDGIVALGGGVVGDLSGFVASIYMRGISFVQIPTSLLAQVDSSVGGKTAVNSVGVKNLIGTFYQPDGVLIDPETLKTLPRNRISEGLAEIVKTAAILDKHLWLTLVDIKSIDDFLAQPIEIIGRCCQLKAMVVESDEKESGRRVILNFGHTIAHGLEAVIASENMTHGQAVAIGMYQLSCMLVDDKNIPPLFIQSLKNMLEKFELQTQMPVINFEAFMHALNSDKKNRGEEIKLVYVNEIGQGKVYTEAFATFENHLRKELL